jgi:hypothetical protein
MAKRKTAKTGAVPPPYALAMVISDAIWRDPGSGKRTILGCFSVLFARRFPAVHPIMAVYAVLTDGRGKVPIKLRVVDVDEENVPLFEANGEVVFADPRATVEIDMHIQGIRFPRPGDYRFQLFAGGEFVLERRLLVVQISDEKKP